MHHRRQHMLVLADPENPCPQRNLARQIERVARHFLDGILQSAFRPAGGIDDIPAEIGPLNRDHHLLRCAPRRDEHRAQALVAAHHVAQRATQGAGVHRTA